CMEGPELTCLQKCYWPKTDSPTIKSEEEPNFSEIPTYTTQFNWAYLDHADAQIGQFGWAYSIYLLHRYGAQEKEAGFYASKVIQAFPHLQEPVPSTRFEGFNLEPALIYRWRFVEHFAGWFGLIEIRKGTNDVFDRQAIIQKAAIFSELFQVDAQKGSVK
ncbi:hypothetical protein, partial [Dyadobacter jiangsuensis]